MAENTPENLISIMRAEEWKMSDSYTHAIIAAWRTTTHNHPLVQCLTNTVVQQFTANVLLAAGCAPAMVDAPDETREFAGIASAILINVGTIAPAQQLAMLQAADSANRAGTPWVLDPVAVGALSVRTSLAHQLLEYKPAVIRGNASEIIALAGGEGGRGTDATDDVAAAEPAARSLAQQLGAIVAVSGKEDFITDGINDRRCNNGHEWLTLVTGAGCSLGALIAGYVGASPREDWLDAVTAAHVVMGIAAQRAAESAQGPGTFAANLVDAIYNTAAETFESLALVS